MTGTEIKYNFQGRQYPIRLSYLKAMEEIPEKFDIHLCNLLSDEQAALDTMKRLVLDDALVLSLINYFIDGAVEWESILENATNKDLDRFREDFWSAVGLFSGPLKKGILDQMWVVVKRELKKTDFEKAMQESLSSDLPQEDSPTES